MSAKAKKLDHLKTGWKRLRTAATSKKGNAMIKRLRIKFVVINMVLAILVLGTTFSVVCYLDYASRVDTIYTELSSMLARAASPNVPQIEGVQKLTTTPSIGTAAEAPVTSQNTSSSSHSSTVTQKPVQITEDTELLADITAPVIGSEASAQSSVILVATYYINPAGIYTTDPTFTNASIPESTLLRANQAVLASEASKGYLPDFGLFYERASYENGYLVSYADGSTTNSWRELAKLLSSMGLLALLAFLAINIFFSRWALRPVALAFKQQEQFTADASHELKTPLTVILANMAILRSQPSQTISEQIQWVESTKTEAERMQLLVNDMLDLARPKDPALSASLVSEKVDLTDLVEGEVLQFESVAFERGINLDSRIQANLFVEGNPERLGRMISTLIDNACKYADDGGTVKVSLNARPSGGIRGEVAKLRVHNDGAAISEEDLPHVFDRFYRADKARTSSKGGYGLGLAIGREIAREHNGDITVSSSERTGTTFTVTLPLAE